MSPHGWRSDPGQERTSERPRWRRWLLPGCVIAVVLGGCGIGLKSAVDMVRQAGAATTVT